MFSTIINKLKSEDKLLHFSLSALLSLLFYLVIGIYNIIPITFLSVGKEVYDTFKKSPTGFSIEDLNADYLAWFITTLICLLII